MDKMGRQARSELMARVKSKGTAPEKALRAALADAGAVPSRSSRGLPGTPDAAFRKAKVAVFVDGCFWHGCPEHGRLPAADPEGYWAAKISGNKERDAKGAAELEAAGWMVVRLWEHQLRRPGDASEAAARIAAAVRLRLGLG